MDIKNKEAFEDNFRKTEIYRRECAIRGKDILEFSKTMGAYFNIVTNDTWNMWQSAKAQAVPEGFVLVSAEQMSQWGHMANCAEDYGCPECFEARGYANSLACEINAYFNVSEAQEQNQ